MKKFWLVALLAFHSFVRADGNLREESTMQVGAGSESWRLEWRDTPGPVCPAGDEIAVTCPCTGFAYGESGDLLLTRNGPTGREELPLTPLFADSETPKGDGSAVLQRWEVKEADFYGDEPIPKADIVRRPAVGIMKFGDYDHDGRSTEFLLQVGTEPCGRRMMVLLGISKANPHLHAFHSVANPKKPLVLQYEEWDALLHAAGPVKIVDWPCGDHGSEIENELEISAVSGDIAVHVRRFSCDDSQERGALIEEKDL